MKETPDGTPVGVDDPHNVAGVCEHLTDDGRCRYALAYPGNDPEFAAARRADEYACHVGEEDNWKACPKYRCTTDGTECVRCGLEKLRLAHDDVRPLLEEHHLSYGSESADDSASERDATPVQHSPDDHDRGTATGVESSPGSAVPPKSRSNDESSQSDSTSDAGPHEITVSLCRWCHAKTHNSIARVDDDASPDPDALAAREQRKSKKQAETGFSTASEREDT